MIRPFRGIIALAFAQALSSTVPASAQGISEQEAYDIAKDAYVYAYPLLLSELTLRQQTNFAEPTGKLAQAPFNSSVTQESLRQPTGK
jgi:hypothetical protein